MSFSTKLLLQVSAICLLTTQVAFARISKVGSQIDVVKSTQPVLCLAGGGNDDLWIDGWKTMLTAVNGGDVVVISPNGNKSGYETWIYKDTGGHHFPKVNSVTTVALGRAADASDAAAVDAVNKAEMIFFEGGDQSVYINFITGSPLHNALENALRRKIPFGGTSAGMAILAGIDFTARYPVSKKVSTVTSAYAMNDPTASFVDLDRDLLVPPFLEKVITDTHFSQRSRQGRLVSFMARAVYNNYGDVNSTNVKGIAADEGTAYCYDMTTGSGKVYGAGRVFFTLGNGPIERIQAGASLDWFAQRQAVKVYSINGSDHATASFNVSNWSGIGGAINFWYVDGTDPSNAVFGQN